MAINYTWSIPLMQAHIEFEGESNVIYQVQYIYLGTEESGGETYSSSFMGSQTYTYEPGETFVPYENTEAFENVVIGWLEGSLDLAEMQAVISERVQEQIAPVNEDLYFTWQNPVTPVE